MNHTTKVLIIEDNQDLAKLFCDLLQILGCETEMALSAQSGIEVAERKEFDLIFCDIHLPGRKNGFDVVRELRAHPRYEKKLLIAVTGYLEGDDPQLCLEAGFDRVFAKPVKFAEMQEVLRSQQQDLSKAQ